MFGKILSKAARAAAKARKAKKTADDAARAKADKAAEGLKGSGESLSTKLRKEAKAKAAEAGPKKTGATPGKKKDTPKKAETDRKTAGQRKKDRDAKTAQATTQRKGSIAKKINVSQEDIKQAKTLNKLSTYKRQLMDEMPKGLRRTMMLDLIKAQIKKIRAKQAAEVDKIGRKATQAKRDKKPFKGYTPKSPFNKGGMPMVKKDGKSIPAFAADGVGKMMKGGMAKKKPTAKKKATAYMYGGMTKKKAKK